MKDARLVLIGQLAIAVCLGVGDAKPAQAPLLRQRPFIVVWNAPTEACRLRFHVDLDLRVFDIVANHNETLSGPNITIFYHTHLGLYPYYSREQLPINGGLPQNQSLVKHLGKAHADIDSLIPFRDFRGLAVIDWENWRPQWVRNWGSKDIYRNKSKELMRSLHPQWPESKVEKEAKEHFERAGQSFMNSTLLLAKSLRPDGLWGFYLFPECYNYGYKQHPQHYTGECPSVEHVRNDHLMWLWRASTALYPSIYLDYELKSTPNTLKFVHYRVKEALRIASIARSDYMLPVFVYSRPFYAYTFHVLSESDLVHTIGESAVLGVHGVVLWGSSEYAQSQRNCLEVKRYIDGSLGRYVVNVTSAAKLCSKALCKKNGKCVRKSLDSGAMLHLNPRFFHIQRNLGSQGPHFRISGHLSHNDILEMKHKFTCQCYQGWTGVFCEVPERAPFPQRPRHNLIELLAILSLHFSLLSVLLIFGVTVKCLLQWKVASHYKAPTVGQNHRKNKISMTNIQRPLYISADQYHSENVSSSETARLKKEQFPV